MLKIIIWRFWFELLSLLKLLGVKGTHRYYFTFGGNLDPRVLKHRRIVTYSTSPQILKGFELKFNHAIPFKGCGFASIEKAPDQSVAGALLEISRIDELRLDCFEACAVIGRYRKGYLELDGKRVFYYYSGRPKDGLKPPKQYVDKILNGYRKLFGNDSPFVKRLEKQDTIESMVDLDPPELFIQNYDVLGIMLKPALIAYDRLCLRVFKFLIFKGSILQPWLKY